MINLDSAHEMALAKFSGIETGEAARRAAVHYDQENRVFKIPFLGKEYSVSHPGGEVTDPWGVRASLTNKLCILHYLTGASDAPPAGRYVTFKELPGGSFYIEPFNNRVIKPLVSIFGPRPEMLVKAGEKLGGRKAGVGNWSVTVDVFPKVPITFVIWEGDDEFPPSGNVLFDATANLHLETEDYALLPGLAVFEMKKLSEL